MPLRLDITRQFIQRSDRVKGVDLHPTEPWLLANLYNGIVAIWNVNDNTMLKSFEVTELPVRSARFIARKQWMVAGSDDMFIRVYNYNTMDKVKAFEAHTDYIRCVSVHPTLPLLLSSSDDMLIKVWDWDKQWACTQVFEGHSHYVMQVVFNPKDTNTFASASLDRTVKVWSIGQPAPNFTLEGHEKGVNCVDYFNGGDRPYLITGADDKLVKVWDYQTKACVQTLEGHTHNVSSVFFHPELPVIVTGSEDGTVRIWHSTTYRLENTLNYGLERVWALAYIKGSNKVAIGYDEGTVMIKLGREEPVASMDASGKVIWARHSEVYTVNVKSAFAAAGEEETIADGERLNLSVKELGSCDLYPQTLDHSPNGRFVVVCGDGEYIVYTALAWRNKSFGSALDVAWSTDANEFAARESTSKVKVMRNFQEKCSFRPPFSAEQVFGGTLLGIRSSDFVCFYDWADPENRVVRRIDVSCRELHWSDSGDYLVITSDSSFYILKFNREVVEAAFSGDEGAPEIGEDGIEDAFELLHEIHERVETGVWVGDCFIYNNSSWRLNYVVGGEVTTLYHLDRPMYLLGYLASHSRVFLVDRDYTICSYTLLLGVVEYKTLVLRGDMEAAAEVLPNIPEDQKNSVARFLEARGMPEEALSIATDNEYRFELAVQLGNLDVAKEIAAELDSENRWRQLGELALGSGDLALADSCLASAKDLSGKLLLGTALGDAKGIEALAESAMAVGKYNVAFVALFVLKRVDACVELLVKAGRVPEAAFFARTYAPAKVSEIVSLWRADLAKVNTKAAEALADPLEYANLFPELEGVSTAPVVPPALDSLPPASTFATGGGEEEAAEEEFVEAEEEEAEEEAEEEEAEEEAEEEEEEEAEEEEEEEADEEEDEAEEEAEEEEEG